MANQNVTYQSTSTLGILGVVLVIFKILGYIQWSWWLVLLPLYGPLVLILGLFLVAIVLAVVSALV